MIKGDRIKLVQPMGVFTNIGEICEVIDVSTGGVISFKFGGGLHLGCMSYDEFEKHFELVEVKPKNSWTKWDSVEELMGNYSYYNPFNGFLNTINAVYKTNGKKVIVKDLDTKIKAHSTCHKNDTFDLFKGIDIAMYRLIGKDINNIIAAEIKRCDTEENYDD